MMGLIQECAGQRHLGVCEHGIPARLLLLEPAPYAFPVGRPSRGGDVIGNVAEPLTQGQHAQALPLSRAVQEGVELRAQRLTHRGRDGRKFARELVDGVAQAVAQARSREERPYTLGGAIEAIDEDPFDMECVISGLGKSLLPSMPQGAAGT